MREIRLFFLVPCGILVVSPASASQSIARLWDEQILSAIRIDAANPPVHARNLFHLSAAIYDAWSAYDTNGAVGYLFREKHPAMDVAAARRQAISYAAWRLLKERYVFSKSSTNTLAALDAQMVALGYDTNDFSLDTSTPVGVGNAVYVAVSNYFINDGALEARAYQDYPTNRGGYAPVNPPLVTGLSGDSNLVDLNRWQPLAITNAVDNNGFPQGPIQTFPSQQRADAG